jgi:hypothetical protein
MTKNELLRVPLTYTYLYYYHSLLLYITLLNIGGNGGKEYIIYIYIVDLWYRYSKDIRIV